MTTILAAIDDSAATKPILETALALAPVLGAAVEAVHVTDAVGRTTQATTQSMKVPLRVLEGDPFTEIAALAGDDNVVAVVVGARARPAGRRPAGHVALALAGVLAKPVVIVPPEARPPARVRRVLIAMEGTPGQARDLQRTIELGAGAGLELVVVHVDNEESIPAFCDQVQYETEAYANEFLARYCRGAPDARLALRVGVPADEILATADDVAPDMLAIGWPQTDDPTRGQVAREIVNRSRLPVLVVALAEQT